MQLSVVHRCQETCAAYPSLALLILLNDQGCYYLCFLVCFASRVIFWGWAVRISFIFILCSPSGAMTKNVGPHHCNHIFFSDDNCVNLPPRILAGNILIIAVRERKLLLDDLRVGLCGGKLHKMMQRALSAEHLADIAHHAVNSLRRLVSSSSLHDANLSPSQQDLTSTSRQIEEAWIKKHVKVDMSIVELWARSFGEELELIASQQSPCSSSADMSIPSSPKIATPILQSTSGGGTPLASTPPSGVSRKHIPEGTMMQAIEGLRAVSRWYGTQCVDVFSTVHLMDAVIRIAHSGQLPKKLNDALLVILADVLSEVPRALEESCTAFSSLLQASDSDELLTPNYLKMMQLFIQVLRRCDVHSGSGADSVRNRCASLGVVTRLLAQVKELRLMFDMVDPARQGRVVTSAILTLSVVACLSRRNQTLKEEILRPEGDAQRSWVFAANNVSKMEAIISYLAVPHTSTKAEERVLSFDHPNVWAADLAEFLIELCTTDSFSLRRQNLFSEVPSTPSTPPSVRSGRPPPVSSAVMVPQRRWEPLPSNWDVTLSSGSAFVWRFASTLSQCHFTCGTAAKCLFHFLWQLDTTTTATSELIFRCVVSSVLLLCNSNPSNVAILSSAGCFRILIEMLCDDKVTAFGGVITSEGGSPLIKSSTMAEPHQGMKLSENARQVIMAALSVMASSCLLADDVAHVMKAVESMREGKTTLEDCEIIEHLLHTVGNTTYPNKILFFSGDASVVCPVEKFVGRWYGYTFLVWVNPSCVWGEGCVLYSYSEPSTPSAVVVSMVANGRAKSLAVRCTSNKDFTITLIPDTTLSNEGWSHIAISHNISGFTVYVNGRKTTNNVSVPYPKEPTRPHRLHFGLGSDCSIAANAFQQQSPKKVGNEDVSPASASVPSLFGYVASMEILDGTLGEKDMERIAQGGPAAGASGSVEPCHSLPCLIGLSSSDVAGEICAEAIGSLVKKEAVTVAGVIGHEVPDVPKAFVSLGVVPWATVLLQSVDNACENRNTIAVLCAEFISTAFKLAGKEEMTKYSEMGVLEDFGRTLLSWPSGVPQQLSNSLISITIPKGGGKKMRQHPTTSSVLNLVIDLMSHPAALSTFCSASLKELSEFLSVPENAKIFREQSSRFTRILRLSTRLPSENVDDLVALLEKLCKEQQEMEQLLRYLVFQDASRHNEVVACETLRMLYDIGRPNTAICEMIAVCFGNCGVWWLVYLVAGTNHKSEAVRIYATRLLALVLHCSKKGKDIFLKGNGFEVIAAAVLNNNPDLSSAPAHVTSGKGAIIAPLRTAPTVRLMTYNCFFKFALDFFQPNNTDSSPPLSTMMSQQPAGGNRHVDPRAGGTFGFHGHLPGLIPPRATRRAVSYDLGYGSECGDVESRLSVDDNYSSQIASKDLLVYPQGIHVVLLLLGKFLRQHVEESVAANSEEPSKDGFISDDFHSATSVTTSREDAIEMVDKVLGFLERIVDMSPNAAAILTYPWLEWLWASVEPLFAAAANEACASPLRQLFAAVEPHVRSIIRKICVVDLSRPVKGSSLRRVKDLVDEPMLQRIVFEEIVRHFSENNRLDTMEPTEATNCIRSLDALLQGIDDALVPFPSTLAVEIVFAIRAIAVNNNSWVRLKMKNNTKLFEVRDRLAFLLMSTIRTFSKEEGDFLQQLIEANMHDLNSMLVVLKGIVDAVGVRNLEEVETLQGMLRMLYSVDDEQRKYLQKILEADAVELLQQRTPSSSPGLAEPPQLQQDFISWCMGHESKWESMTARILKAYKPVDAEIRSQADRREKERTSRLKARKSDGEKKAASLLKGQQELEKIRADIEGKGLQTFQETIAEAQAVEHRDANKDS